MLDYCQQQSADNRAHSGGGTDGDHRRVLIDQGMLDPIEEPEIPTELNYLYNIFIDLKY